ncbi:MAG: hypothetical protein EP335_13115 [Alphaproteobacteria bacterium]|nr:MAG: hypothetical protein EP335_13115 [Alphaproteobacteria bacterium]
MPKAVFQMAALAVLLAGSSLVEAFLPVIIHAAVPGTAEGTRIMPADEKGTIKGWKKCMADYWESAGPYATPDAATKACHDRIAVTFKDVLQVEGVAFSGDDCTNSAGQFRIGSFLATVSNVSEDTVVTAAAIELVNDELEARRSGDIEGWLAPGKSFTTCIDVWDKALQTSADFDLFFDRPELTRFHARNIQGITLAERAYPR